MQILKERRLETFPSRVRPFPWDISGNFFKER